MKRAVIVHCWGGNPDYAWYPWAKTQLEAKGYQVSVPEMPNTDEPRYSEWLSKLKEAAKEPDDELLLIGHSLGCITIMRYLESIDGKQSIRKVIFVAGFTDPLGFQEIESFFVDEIDFNKIKGKSHDGFVAIQSDNDPYVAIKEGKILQNKLDVKLIIKHGAFHMSGAVDDEPACEELPELLEST